MGLAEARVGQVSMVSHRGDHPRAHDQSGRARINAEVRKPPNPNVLVTKQHVAQADSLRPICCPVTSLCCPQVTCLHACGLGFVGVGGSDWSLGTLPLVSGERGVWGQILLQIKFQWFPQLRRLQSGEQTVWD